MSPALDLPPLIGHRGAAAEAPENTLASFRRAAEAGARWVEFDVKLSADGVPIVIHDARLDRTTSGRGLVRACPFAAIRKLDAGSWFDRRFAGERVPSLDEAVALCLDLGLGINVELKPCPGLAETTARAAIDTLTRHGAPRDGRVLISSFEPRCLAIAQTLAPALPRGHLCGFVPRDWPAALARYGCTTLHANQLRISRRRLAALRAAGARILLYTVNDPGRARQLLADGATAVFTDRVTDLARALQAPAVAPSPAQ